MSPSVPASPLHCAHAGASQVLELLCHTHVHCKHCQQGISGKAKIFLKKGKYRIYVIMLIWDPSVTALQALMFSWSFEK